jgi:hypothetical protein
MWIRLFLSSLNVKIVDYSDMENFERLSNKVLSRTCLCGIVLKRMIQKKCTIQTVVGQVTLRKEMEQ